MDWTTADIPALAGPTADGDDAWQAYADPKLANLPFAVEPTTESMTATAGR
jgi:hypothetical protein